MIYAADTTGLTDPSLWAQHGPMGLVALFVLVCCAWLVRWLVTHLDSRAAAHSAERAEWRAEHTAERDEWRAVILSDANQHREERQEWRSVAAEASAATHRLIESQNKLATKLEAGLEEVAKHLNETRNA